MQVVLGDPCARVGWPPKGFRNTGWEPLIESQTSFWHSKHTKRGLKRGKRILQGQFLIATGTLRKKLQGGQHLSFCSQQGPQKHPVLPLTWILSSPSQCVRAFPVFYVQSLSTSSKFFLTTVCNIQQNLTIWCICVGDHSDGTLYGKHVRQPTTLTGALTKPFTCS